MEEGLGAKNEFNKHRKFCLPLKKRSTGYVGQHLFCSHDNSVPTFVIHLNDELAGVVHLLKKKTLYSLKHLFIQCMGKMSKNSHK